MKKMIIGSLMGGLILFFWQFLSWSILNIHGSQTTYLQSQDAILECLASNNVPEGEYYLPNLPTEATRAEREAAMPSLMGKPWARISYHHKFEMNMGLNMFRGFVINFFSVMLLCYLLLGDNSLTFKKVMFASLAVGAISYMTFPYLESIWFSNNTIPYLIDAAVQWTVAGLFLAWYLPNKKG